MILAHERQLHPLPQLPLRLIRAATEAHGDELSDDFAILIVGADSR
jgi:hypothetical protein